MDTGRRIRSPGSARNETDAGPAGYLADRLRHHGGGALVTADCEFDVAAIESIKRGKIAFARHAKNMLHTLDRQLVDQNFAAGACIILAAHRITSRSSPAESSARREQASSASWPVL